MKKILEVIFNENDFRDKLTYDISTSELEDKVFNHLASYIVEHAIVEPVYDFSYYNATVELPLRQRTLVDLSEQEKATMSESDPNASEELTQALEALEKLTEARSKRVAMWKAFESIHAGEKPLKARTIKKYLESVTDDEMVLTVVKVIDLA